MSDPVISFQKSGFTAQTLASATIVSLPEVPPEMAEMPAGSVLPGIVRPPETPSAAPVLQISLPDGKQAEIPFKPAHLPAVPTPVGIKILSIDTQKGVMMRVHFSAHQPDMNKAVKDLPEALRAEADVSTAAAKRTVSVRAFVLHSVPEQISAVMNELESPAGGTLPAPLKPHQSVRLELSPSLSRTPASAPEQTVLQPAAGVKTANPALAINTPEQPPVSADHPLPQTATPVSPTPVSADAPPPLQPPAAQNASDVVAQPAPQTPVPPTPPQTAAPLPAVAEQVPSSAAAVPVQTENALPAAPAIAPAQQPQAAAVLPEKPEIAPVGNDASPLTRTDGQTETPSAAPAFPAQETTGAAPVHIPLRGVVFDFKERSAPLIVTKIGVLALEEKIQLPHLTPVEVKITTIDEPPPPVLTERRDETVFQAFKEALAGLQKSDPAAFESLKSILPQTGVKMPALLHTFINAVSQGVPLASFIGEANAIAIQNLGEKGRSLISEMEKEFSSSSKRVSDGRGSWKALSIPVLSGAVVEPVSLYLQRPQEDGGQRSGTAVKQNAVRFVLDLNLSKLGKLQMDGLAHRNERRFDLIVRHRDDLPDSFDENVRRIFTQTLTALNYTGTVKVDHTDQFIVLTEEAENKPKPGVWA